MRSRPERSILCLLGTVIGAWAIVPPYVIVFGRLHLQQRVEIADHVVPGLVVLVVSLVGYLQLRSGEPSGPLLFAGGGVIGLAGFWMIATHVPLIAQARQGLVPGGAVFWHGLPGLAVCLFGISWASRFWDWEESEKPSLAARDEEPDAESGEGS